MFRLFSTYGHFQSLSRQEEHTGAECRDKDKSMLNFLLRGGQLIFSFKKPIETNAKPVWMSHLMQVQENPHRTARQGL